MPTDELRRVVVYYDVSTGKIYDFSGKSYENNTLTASLDSKFTLEMHYVNSVSKDVLPENWEVWSFLEGQDISSTLAYDEDYVHAFDGEVAEDIEKGSHTVVVSVAGINKDTLSPFGILIINPFGSATQQEVVSYSSFTYISKDKYSFTIEDSMGVSSFISSGTQVRVSDPLFIFVDSSKVYEANIPNRYDEGVFEFPIHVLSRKLLKALDNTNIKGVSGKIEHKIYIKKSNLVGILISGYDDVFTRNIKKDVVAIDSSDSKASLFCGWSAGDITYWTKGKAVQDGSSLYVLESGEVSLVENSLTCSYEDKIVLVKSFQFPFIVKNLVDYNATLNVPLQSSDWVRTYIINTVRNNMDEELTDEVRQNIIDEAVSSASYAGGSVIDIGSDYDEAPPT